MNIPRSAGVGTPSSQVAQTVDSITLFVMGVSVVLLLLITFLMIYFVIKYNRKRHPKSVPVRGGAWLEVTWTVFPTLLVLAMFWYGYEGFTMLRDVPPGAMTVNVTGRMWDWSFEYENGKRTDQLYAPVNKPVKLVLKSVDVIHSLYIPAFRIKEDAVPGRENYTWFKADETGPADIYCAEYCGDNHSYMLSKVIVMPEEEFDEWYGSQAAAPDSDEAKMVQLFNEHNCTGCHALRGLNTPKAPTFAGIWKRETVVVEGGQEHKVVADEEYLRRSIRSPGTQIVKGYADVMPPARLSDEELKQIIEYFKML